MKRRPWTADEDRMLVEGAGVFGLGWFKKRVGSSWNYPNAPARTNDALYARARRLWGRGGFSRGVYSLRQLSQESGYSLTQILRAQSALNHKYKRLSPRGPFLVSYDQREDIYAWLAHDYWAKRLRLYNCVWCHGTETPHKGAGLCAKCYFAHRRLCAKHALPAQLEAQAALLEGIDADEPTRQQAQERLRRGWALPRSLLALAASKLGRC